MYLDAVEFYPVTDSANRLELLQNGELDALQTTDQATIKDIKDDDTIQGVLDDSGEESLRR